MRFLILVHAASGATADGLAAFHGALASAGVLLEGHALLPATAGWRVALDAAGGRTLREGAGDAGPRSLVAGALIEVRTREEALAWSRRLPSPCPGVPCELELRPLADAAALPARSPGARFRDLDRALDAWAR